MVRSKVAGSRSVGSPVVIPGEAPGAIRYRTEAPGRHRGSGIRSFHPGGVTGHSLTYTHLPDLRAAKLPDP